MTTFKPRVDSFAHQVEGVKNLIKHDGIYALLWEPGCLAAGTVVQINRAGGSRSYTLRELERKFNRKSRDWDLSIDTYIQRDVDGVVRLGKVSGVWFSGLKQTYTVMTAGGRQIRATDEHPFLTEYGWQRLDELMPGTRVRVRGTQRASSKAEAQPDYLLTSWLKHHPHARQPNRRKSPFRVPTHRVVVEAALNGLGLNEYLKRLRTGEAVDGLTFLSPEVHVHHHNHDRRDNRLENLQVLTAEEHHALHAVEDVRNVLYKTELDEITSITPHGVEETFDISVEDDPHNFIANEFVVHNTGKTKCVIDYLSWLATAARREVRVLVVCPKAVTDSWVDQMALHCAVPHREDVLTGSINDKAAALAVWKTAPTAGYPMITLQVINLETFSSRRQVSKTSSKMHSDLLLESVKKYAPHVLVVDESHRIKGKSSNAARLLARVSKHVKRRILLTGTPMPHGPMDVWSQWGVLDPSAFSTNGKPWSFSQFQQNYAVMGGYMGKEIMGYHRLDDLQRRMGQRSMVVRKEDALDLPPTTEVVHKFAMEPAEERAYRKMMNDLLVVLDSGVMSAPSRLTQMLRLRQIVSGYVRADGAEEYKYIGEGRLRATLELLQDLCPTEHRLVVFAWGRPEVDRLVERINASRELTGFVAHAITGDTPDVERMRLRKKFAETGGEDRLILVCQWRTVSLGINEFVSASHAIFLSLSQQRDDLIQGKARLDRQGQTKPVTFHYVECPGTIDSVIRKAHTDRTDLESAILSHLRGGLK